MLILKGYVRLYFHEGKTSINAYPWESILSLMIFNKIISELDQDMEEVKAYLDD
jgi:hypothetical protein